MDGYLYKVLITHLYGYLFTHIVTSLLREQKQLRTCKEFYNLCGGQFVRVIIWPF